MLNSQFFLFAKCIYFTLRVATKKGTKALYQAAMIEVGFPTRTSGDSGRRPNKRV